MALGFALAHHSETLIEAEPIDVGNFAFLLRILAGSPI